MYLSGRVNNILFEDPAKGFYVLKMVLDPSQEVTKVQMADGQATVTGHVPGLTIKVGTWFGFEASWVSHKTYGKQLQISRAPVLRDGLDPNTAMRMLVGNGVGEGVAKAIRDYFEDEGFVAALSDAKAMAKVPGVAELTAQHVAARWTAAKAHFRTLVFLNDLGIPREAVSAVWREFGDDAEKVLSEDPWALVQVDGVSFSHADAVAKHLGLDSGSPRRVRGAVLWACRNQRGMGHLYLKSGDLYSEVSVMVDADAQTFAGVLAELHQAGTIVLDRKARPGLLAIYEPRAHALEKDSAHLLADRTRMASYELGSLDAIEYVRALKSVGPDTEAVAVAGGSVMDVAREAIEEWGRRSSIVLSPDQKQGVLNALTQPVSILTGLPGTGKTTSLRAAVSILKDAGVQALLVAPTGIAAKNLAARTNSTASTIHRAFSAKGGKDDDGRETTYAGIVGDGSRIVGEAGGDDWGFSADKTHPARVVIMDECSMIDQHLLFRVLSCTSVTCRLVMVGDPAQLPSVGPGNVLRDVISSGQFPTVDLRAIFRQQDASPIVMAAHAIHAGDVPDCEPPSDFALLEIDREEDVLQTIMKLSQRMYAKRDNFQILSPRHGGVVGVTNLNARIRELLNPKAPGLQEARLGSDAIREGDRIMVIKNNYQMGVFNGDVGKVARIDKAAKEIEVKIHGPVPLFVRVPFADAPRYLRLAYACTIHKSQGLEYDKIVMPLVPSFRQQLQRNLLYTAITRARKQVILVGSRQALAQAVYNDREDMRNTLLPDRIAQALADLAAANPVKG